MHFGIDLDQEEAFLGALLWLGLILPLIFVYPPSPLLAAILLNDLVIDVMIKLLIKGTTPSR